MWLPGQAPPLRRHGRRPGKRTDFGLARLQATDILDPIGGEWLDLTNPAPTPRAVAGLVLTNDRGDRLVLPDLVIEPGRMLRVWTRNPEPGRRALSWDLDHEAWSDTGDCARLLDANGDLVDALRFGPKSVSCPVPDAAPGPAEDEATESAEEQPLAIPVAPAPPAPPAPPPP
jgi:hypothetical protein